MSAPLLIPDPVVAGDLAPQGQCGSTTPHQPLQSEVISPVANKLMRGASTLGASVLVERGTGFLANILAARFGGAAVFGAYSLGISTANNISTYAAGGIGATATRFSGKYTVESGGYATFARVLATVAIVSAAIASTALWLGAAPIAALLHEPQLLHLLRWASLSAAGMILLESARGFFVGQHRLAALGVLSISVGVGMVLLLPVMAATHHPTAMIVAQGSVTTAAVCVCLLLARPLKLLVRSAAAFRVSFATMLREVWAFGFIQLSGLLSANVAGWWLTALLAREDATLVQIGFFAIASQLRNLTGIVPALLTESGYSVMAGENHTESLPDRVMALFTFAAISISFSLAGMATLLLPWALRLLYGTHYTNAVGAAAIAMGVAVVQMGNAPATARMSVVSIRWVAIGNTLWAVVVAAVGSWLLIHHGSAAAAMAVFFVGHVLLALVVFTVLRQHRHLPAGVVSLFLISTGAIAMLDVLALWRAHHPQVIWMTAAMFVIYAAGLTALYLLGRRHGWLSALHRPAQMFSALATTARLKLRLRGEA
jgi:O-antigen/teichoic acid export membrane protein